MVNRSNFKLEDARVDCSTEWWRLWPTRGEEGEGESLGVCHPSGILFFALHTTCLETRFGDSWLMLILLILIVRFVSPVYWPRRWWSTSLAQLVACLIAGLDSDRDRYRSLLFREGKISNVPSSRCWLGRQTLLQSCALWCRRHFTRLFLCKRICRSSAFQSWLRPARRTRRLQLTHR